MGLNKQKGNMYPFVTHTWNPIRGKCPHDCSYCYMKIYPQLELHFSEKEMLTNLGSGNFIFVGSSTDMWAEEIRTYWIQSVLWKCNFYPDNRYLFQSKNPGRFPTSGLPPQSILGTTIETNRDYPDITRAPSPEKRMEAMQLLKLPKMVSIEPVMDFDLNTLMDWIYCIAPEFVSIGADSKNHHLPEPRPEKVQELVKELRGFTKVYIKDNLSRLLLEKV